MAFHIGYVGLCDRNIKHIYTTKDIKPPATRKVIPYKPEFLREQDRIRQDRLRNRRFMEYYPMHDIELPKAPSFRTLPKSDVEGVVSRLMQTSSERFNFKFSNQHAHHDWRQAHDEKIKRLRDVMTKLGASKRKPEIELIDSKTSEPNGKRRKREKRNKNNVMEEIGELENDTRKLSLVEKSDYVEKLPPLA